MNATPQKIEKLLSNLIAEGEAVLKTEWQQRGNWGGRTNYFRRVIGVFSMARSM